MEREHTLTQNWKLPLIYISQKRQGHKRLNLKKKKHSVKKDWEYVHTHTFLDNIFWNFLKTLF